MSKSEKSEFESEIFSNNKFPVSPNFFFRGSNYLNTGNSENAGPFSPLIGNYRHFKPMGPFRFSSPNNPTTCSKADTEFLPMINHQFDLHIELPTEHKENSLSYLDNKNLPFSPLLTIPTFTSFKQKIEPPPQVVANSRMIFNPLKTHNSPVDKNFLMQDSIIGRNNESSVKILTVYLQKFNSFYKFPKPTIAIPKVNIEIANNDNCDRGNKFVKKIKKKGRHATTMRIQKRIKANTRCNCKNSECLKDYCKCYSNGVDCGLNCKCRSCKNIRFTRQLRDERPRSNLSPNVKTTEQAPSSKNKTMIKIQSFDSKPSRQSGVSCCNCKKSMCVKKYCECFSNGAFCTSNCNCQQCANPEA
jgi:hypothetical protein